jgi:branched-chain amino acid transport system substrate-binding protein
VVAISALAAAMATGCGSAAKGTSAAPAAATGASAAASSSTGSRASGQPIVVGLDSLEGGVVSLPSLRIAAQAAASRINQSGGIAGRPIDYVVCNTDGTAQASIACGNKFVSDHVVAVLNTYDTAADAMLPILKSAGIPMFGHAAFGPVQLQASTNARFFGTANQSYTAGFLLYYKSKSISHILLFEPDNAFYHEQVSALVDPIARGLGLDVKVDYYNTTNPNWQTLATEAVAAHPQVAGTASAPDADCVSMLQGLKSAGYNGQIFLGPCSLFLVAAKSQAVGVTTIADLWKITDPAAAPASVQQQLRIYEQAMQAAGASQYAGTYAQYFFSDTMDFAAVLTSIHGAITPSTVSAALLGFKGQSDMGQTLDCGGAWPGASACGNQVLMYQVAPSGTQMVASPSWISTVSTEQYLKA